MSLNRIKYLEWDSKFFNLNIASITLDFWDYNFLVNSLNDCKIKNYDLIYLILEGGFYLPAIVKDTFNCLLVDEKIIYYSEIAENFNISPFIEEFHGSPQLLYNLAFQAGMNSRFKIDENFIYTDFLRLYKTWVDNSVNNIIADKVYVYKKMDRIIGFITLKKNVDEITIGLLATDTLQRGKGIGSSLLQFAKEYTRQCKKYFLSVATQKRNTTACKFYEKNGMKQKIHNNIYHIWLKNNHDTF